MSRSTTHFAKRPHTTVLIIPTGIGAAIGGYAGDALPVARTLASVTDRLITHPNVLNGAQLYWPMDNTLYVEGYGLDQFAAGRWGLRPVHQNAIGIVIDRGVEDELRWRHLQAADAARATLGLDVRAHVVTDKPLGVTLKTSEAGASGGTLENPDSELRAAERLIVEAQVSAIAVIARFPDDEGSDALDAYRQGKGVDPNEAEAADWFERAAIAGNPVAMNRLARIYAYGRGREQDFTAAAGWHLAARSNGVPDFNLDRIVETLDEKTIEDARVLAEQHTTTLLAPSEDPAAESP